MTIVEHGKEGYLGQPPLPHQPPFHLGQGGSGSESALETFEYKQNIKDLKI